MSELADLLRANLAQNNLLVREISTVKRLINSCQARVVEGVEAAYEGIRNTVGATSLIQIGLVVRMNTCRSAAMVFVQ
ncbi:hypothetical protein L596_025204 [Steinernema carpocapsae]|uniref:Uncharacterized protein n=1 Tax=Steinernema carpocapsae TaxID=34508 RepID=A0A4U5M764_STECR|nr:hypothetical protein L596_025204 [Steinernema carpocapsae]